MRRMSLKNKIILWFSAILLLLSFFILYAMTTISQSLIISNIEENLITSVINIGTELKNPKYSNEMIPEHLLYNDGVQMVIHNSNNHIILGVEPFGIDEEIPFEDNYLRTIHKDNKDYYVYDKEVILSSKETYIVRGMVCISEETSAIQVAVQYNILSIIILMVLAILGGIIIINGAFRPINNMRKTAKEIANSNDLTQRISEYDGSDEIHSLTKTFNKMLDKVESSFNKEKQFTSDASHELRTPISVILTECEYGEVCLEKIEDVEELKEIFASIKYQANKMSKLVSELLMISRMDSNRLKIHFEDTNVSELLTFVCEEQVEIQKKNISLIQNINPDIYCEVDRLLITRLFVNLISNAYQYSEENTKIEVNLYEENNKVVFSVKDEGIGIAKEDIEKIWDRFYQVDSSRVEDGNSSSGLGLPMVKWISACHKGNLEVISELNKGSTFIFRIDNNGVL